MGPFKRVYMAGVVTLLVVGHQACTECRPDEVRRNGRCVALCNTDDDCRSSERCEGGYCEEGARDPDTHQDAGVCVPHPGPETACVDGVDNDCNHVKDCQDPACQGVACGSFGRVCSMAGCRCPTGELETDCGNNADDDCDGDVDCADEDCVGLACDDGEACTHTDQCADGTCIGVTLVCVSNTCATLTCNGTPQCKATYHDVVCDDGNACTHSDRCVQGVCTGTVVDCSGSNVCVQLECNGTEQCNVTYHDNVACDDANVCTHTDRCGQGVCKGTAIQCASTACTTRTCNGTATCTEVHQAPETPCTSDGKVCTVDSCDGAGTCLHRNLEDGTSCGTQQSYRCCGGSCVDTSNDNLHCGGCDLACGPGFVCQSVATTIDCSTTPQKVSGRCQCNGSDAHCPNGQVCRNADPYKNRCTPKDATSCAPNQTVVNLDACPDYCVY